MTTLLAHLHRRFALGGALIIALFAVLPATLHAQDHSDQLDEIERMVIAGQVDALEARFRGSRTPEECRLLALAQTNKAARISDDRQRQREFADAESRFMEWIGAIERDRESENLQRAVDTTAARVACAGMILSQWSAPDLDEFELTAGRRGETRRLINLLLKARKFYEQAESAIDPLADELLTADPATEDRYLALGIYDAIPRLQLDIRFNLAWTNLYLGIVDPRNDSRRAAGLRSAERAFQRLFDSGQRGETAARCALGLAMTLREQGRYDEAARYFESAMDEAAGGALVAQIRYERARSEITAGRYEEARVALRPLVDKDPDRLAPPEQPARFYVNLAHLWDANSYLVEAERLEKTAAGSAAEKAIRLRAERARETGLSKMNILAARGGPWPALVQLFAGEAVDTNADAETLSAAELLFSARRCSEDKKYRRALAQLQEAATREDVPPELEAEIMFEQAVCHYHCNQTREAAELFGRLAREHPSHRNAEKAASYAYQLWARVAEETGRREDYLSLADVLLNRLQNFPRDENRAEASWWLPLALQAGGRYREAIEQFGNVPEDSPHYDEARFRTLLCQRLLFEEERASFSPSQLRARADSITEKLVSYAGQAYERASSMDDEQDPERERRTDADLARERSATALVSAAEVQASSGVERHQRALELLADFEQLYPGSEQIGRVLAVRMDADRALGQYGEAAAVVEQFLQKVPPDQAGGTLAAVARGMQDEVQRLEREGDSDAARKLALQALPIFEQLETWVSADPSRANYVETVWYGLARMRYLAGQYESARELVAKLLEKDPRDGNYQRLNALVLTAAVSTDDQNPERKRRDQDQNPERERRASDHAKRVAEARDAWGALLRDPALKATAPERYWEARYNYLALMLRAGEAKEVENAIRQERVWSSDLGGSEWKPKLDELYQQAAERIGEDTADSQPVSIPPTQSVPVPP